MIAIFTILLLLLATNARGSEYVDLKHGHISKNVEVFHGYMMELGTYKMFMGSPNHDIEYVFWGGDLIHPLEGYVPGSKMLLVESFKAGIMHFAVIYDYDKNEVGTIVPCKLYYELTETGYRRITSKTFYDLIFDRVYLTFDISAPTRHPFIHEDVNSDKEPGTITTRYTIKKAFRGINVHGIGTQRYMFGRVHDSKMKSACGYSKLNYMVTKCSCVEVQKK